MRRVIVVTLFILGVLSIAPVSAGYLPCNIGHLENFLNNPKYFNGWEDVSKHDLFDKWVHTSIGFESRHINTSHKPRAVKGRRFIRMGSPHFGFKDNRFSEIYRLTADSKVLDCLGNTFPRSEGAILAGFKGSRRVPRHGSGHVDIMNEMKHTEPVPEPASLLLLGSGLIGIAGFMRRKVKE